MGESHTTVERGSLENIADIRTSEAAFEATVCRCCDHADHAAVMLQKLGSWIEECDTLEGKEVSAFERWLP
jgi:hypothetical protein